MCKVLTCEMASSEIVRCIFRGLLWTLQQMTSIDCWWSCPWHTCILYISWLCIFAALSHKCQYHVLCQIRVLKKENAQQHALKSMEIVLQFEMPAVNFESQYKVSFKMIRLNKLPIQSQNYTTWSVWVKLSDYTIHQYKYNHWIFTKIAYAMSQTDEKFHWRHFLLTWISFDSIPTSHKTFGECLVAVCVEAKSVAAIGFIATRF